MSDLDTAPRWALDLLVAVIEHEDVHRPESPCVGEALEKVPAEIRAYARGFAAGVRRGGGGS